MSFKSGFVTILGRPNVGKSTLLNTIIGEKVSIVSPKPQTTRNKILGIYNSQNAQVVFTDTPGIHSSANKLDEYMQKSIDTAKQGVDVLLLVLDGTKPIKQGDIDWINSFSKYKNVIVVINKIDDTSFEKLYPQLSKLNDLEHVKEIYPISAKTGKNVDELLKNIIDLLPEGVPYFDQDSYTDKSVRFMIAEIVREKALWLLQDEIPHGIACEVIAYKEDDKKVVIDLDIICERDNHKMIIIGKKGSMLKEIGTRARQDIEKLLGKKVFLNIFVKVRADWRNKESYVESVGYNKTDL